MLIPTTNHKLRSLLLVHAFVGFVGGQYKLNPQSASEALTHSCKCDALNGLIPTILLYTEHVQRRFWSYTPRISSRPLVHERRSQTNDRSEIERQAITQVYRHKITVHAFQRKRRSA